MKFIHTADLHLDSPFDNLQGQSTPNSLWRRFYKSTFQSFDRIVKAAINEKVDFVLIVGDLFDRNNQDVRSQAFLKRELEILNRNRIPVLISFGNHDFYNGDYHRLDYPDNTYVFPRKVTTKRLTLRDGTVVAVTGFSYGRRWESQRVIQDFPVKGDCDYQIGMIHGQVSSGQSHYTPFSLDELRAKHYDYWALGHVHKRQILSKRPVIAYSGNIQGRNPNETGEKGYLLVNDDDHQLRPRFEPTSVIDWRTLSIDVKVVNNEQDLIDLILETLQNQNYPKLNLINVQLNVPSPNTLSTAMMTLIYNQNLLLQIQAELKDRYQELNAWVYNVDLHVNQINHSRWDNQFWQASAKRVFQVDNLDRTAKKLFQYPFINRRFNNSEAIKKLKKRIIPLMLNHRGSQDEN